MKNEDMQIIRLELEGAVEFFQEELINIRTGRANPLLVEDLEMEYYGSKTPLKQVASISVQDARTIVITPWSKDSLVDIEKAVSESDLNLNPVNDGNVIRLVFPQLTEERRMELVKVMKKKTEEARIKVRKVREDAWDGIQKKEKDGKISEDDKFRQKDSLQGIIDEFNKKIEQLSDKKEEEVMQV
ncbi:MAG: ribosome recycling factor [Patescibacteria group bacterium]|nr:ribosome recycling factor [Patescibacteria group bacterium]